MTRGEIAGVALRLVLDRLRNANSDNTENSESCKGYGCLSCKNFIRKEGYDQQWGQFGLFYYKCKAQPDRNMYKDTYNIFDIEPNYNPNFTYNKAKGECPYFERGENEIIHMSDKEKNRILRQE